MTELDIWEELPQLSYDNVERSWRREFKVANMGAMLGQGAKRKTFRPETVTIEFARRNDAPAVLQKVFFKGPFIGAEGIGMRVFRMRDRDDLALGLRAKIDSIVEEVAGVPPRESVFAKIGRRANGWTTEPFTPEEEKLWETFKQMERTFNKLQGTA